MENSSQQTLLGPSTINRQPLITSRVVPSNYYNHPHPNWATTLFQQWGPRTWNGHHQRLQTQDSPCISACTTATNLSTLGDSNSTINTYRKYHLNENLRMTIPEIEPLQQRKDGHDEAEVAPKQKLTFGQMKIQLLTAVAVSWVSMIIGYCTAYTSPAAISLKKDFNLEKDVISWIGSLMPLGALAGGLLGGTVIEILGRKWTILLTDLMFLVAWLVNYFAQNYIYMYVSRMISGVSVGVLSLTLPVYLAETIQPEVRGTLGLLPTAFGNIGILLCYLFGGYFQWQILALIGVILSVPFVLVFVWFIPETPRFLISRGNEEGTKKSLQWLRGSETDIEKEFLELKKSQSESEEEKTSFKVLFSKNNFKLLGIVLGLMFFQQMSGINAVIFHTTTIFKAGSSVDETLCTTIVGVVNFISTFIAAILIDKLGRKVLLYISSVSMIVSLGVLGTYFFLLKNNVDVSQFGLVPLISFIVYVLGFSLGFGPVPWLMMGEILPARIRGPAASLATAFNWSFTFFVTKIFLLMDYHFAFWLFGGIVVAGLVFTITCVPETRGQSLADIERKLAGIKVRRMSSVANMKPMPSGV